MEYFSDFPVKPKKFFFIDLLKFSNINVSNWVFSTPFGMFFSVSWFFWDQKIHFLRKVDLLEHIVLEFPRWRNAKRREVHWKLKLQLTFIQKNMVQFFLPRLYRNFCSCARALHRKIFCFPPCVRILIDWCCDEIATSFEKTRFPLTSFLHNFLLDFLHQAPNWKLSTRSKPNPWKIVRFGYEFRSWSTFGLMFLGNLRFDFVIEISTENHTFSGGFAWKVFCFEPCIRILIVRIFQKNFFELWYNFIFQLSFLRNYRLDFFFWALNPPLYSCTCDLIEKSFTQTLA